MMITQYRANNQAEGDSNMLIKSLMENKKKKRKKKPFFCLKGMEAACCGAHGVCLPATIKIRRSHGASCISSEKRQAMRQIGEEGLDFPCFCVRPQHWYFWWPKLRRP